MTLEWKTRKVSTQSGEYREAQTLVTQHYTTDGRFTITKSGTMKYARDCGIRGHLNYRWRWTGYRFTDLLAPDYVARTRRYTSVADAKREAARRIMRGL